jgi:putative membrane protein insertion efficiency factor
MASSPSPSGLNPVSRVLVVLLSLPIRAYRKLLSPLLPSACRYHPTCSQYALDALAEHGPIYGLLLAMWRIVRCAPWGSYGFDPVPSRGSSPSPKDARRSAVVTP